MGELSSILILTGEDGEGWAALKFMFTIGTNYLMRLGVLGREKKRNHLFLMR